MRKVSTRTIPQKLIGNGGCDREVGRSNWWRENVWVTVNRALNRLVLLGWRFGHTIDITPWDPGRSVVTFKNIWPELGLHSTELNSRVLSFYLKRSSKLLQPPKLLVYGSTFCFLASFRASYCFCFFRFLFNFNFSALDNTTDSSTR